MTDRDTILAEIAALCNVEDRESLPQPNFTAAEVARVLGTSPDVAFKRLKRKVGSGVLGSRQVAHDGHRCTVFWKK